MEKQKINTKTFTIISSNVLPIGPYFR